jgi:hypothetical protein
MTINLVGLINGKRLRACSNQARLLWPYLYLRSNALGRLELDPDRLSMELFSSFDPPISPGTIEEALAEYAHTHLLFVYSHDGQLWGVWDTPDKYLPRYRTQARRESPVPPQPEFSNWLAEYRQKNTTLALLSQLLTETHGDPLRPTAIHSESPRSTGNTENKPVPRLTVTHVNSRLGVGVGVGVGNDREEFDVESAFQELWAVYPAKGRVDIGLARTYFVEEIGSKEIFQAAFESVTTGKWARSKKWAQGFVKAFPAWLHNRAWETEDPEPAATEAHDPYRKAPVPVEAA